MEYSPRYKDFTKRKQYDSIHSSRGSYEGYIRSPHNSHRHVTNIFIDSKIGIMSIRVVKIIDGYMRIKMSMTIEMLAH